MLSIGLQTFCQLQFYSIHDRTRLTRSVFILVFSSSLFSTPVFITCSSDQNGDGYFYVRLYCTGFCFHANIVVEGVTLSALSDIFVGLKRT